MGLESSCAICCCSENCVAADHHLHGLSRIHLRIAEHHRLGRDWRYDCSVRKRVSLEHRRPPRAIDSQTPQAVLQSRPAHHCDNICRNDLQGSGDLYAHLPLITRGYRRTAVHPPRMAAIEGHCCLHLGRRRCVVQDCAVDANIGRKGRGKRESSPSGPKR